MSLISLCGLIKLINSLNLLNFQIQVMRKRKYISPESTEVRLQAAHILASSIGVDSSTNVDESDKSNGRYWGSDEPWAETYQDAKD